MRMKCCGCWQVLTGVFQSELSGGDILYLSSGLAQCAFVSGIPSIVLAWLIQCVVVMVRTKKIERTDRGSRRSSA